jgi:hypothetical protein
MNDSRDAGADRALAIQPEGLCLVLGMPILLMVKTMCDRVDDLKPVGELLGA